jgi:hypothetical protein
MPVPIASRGGLTGGASAMNLSIRQFLHPWKPRHGPRRRRGPWTRRLNFGISIAIYGVVALVAALMLVGIPLVIVGVIAWVGWPRWPPPRPARAGPTEGHN